jgi:hypothetical protein
LRPVHAFHLSDDGIRNVRWEFVEAFLLGALVTIGFAEIDDRRPLMAGLGIETLLNVPYLW